MATCQALNLCCVVVQGLNHAARLSSTNLGLELGDASVAHEANRATVQQPKAHREVAKESNHLE